VLIPEFPNAHVPVVKLDHYATSNAFQSYDSTDSIHLFQSSLASSKFQYPSPLHSTHLVGFQVFTYLYAFDLVEVEFC
jgi:hypothetical protein